MVKFRRHYHRLLTYGLLVALMSLATQVASADCFTDQKLPRVLQAKTNEAESSYNCAASSEALNALFVGGGTAAGSLLQRPAVSAGVVTRINLQTQKTDWSKSYAYSGSSTEYVAALAIRTKKEDKIAIVLSEIGGTKETKVFAVRTEDGSIRQQMIRFYHSTTVDAQAMHIVGPQSIIWNPYDRIMVLFTPVTTRTNNEGGVLAFGMIRRAHTDFMASNGNQYQSLFHNGYWGSLHYVKYTRGNGANFFIGGARNHAERGETPDWRWSMLRVNTNGDPSEQISIKYNSANTDHTAVSYPRIMFFDSPYWFGATRNIGVAKELAYDTGIFFAKEQYKVLVRKNSEFFYMGFQDWAQNSYVVGMKPQLVYQDDPEKPGAHCILSMFKDGQYKLYYYVVVMNDFQARALIELYDNHNYIWAHAVFHGSNVETGLTDDYDVYQAYIATAMTNTLQSKVYGKQAGFVLPVHFDSENCLTRTGGISNLNVENLVTDFKISDDGIEEMRQMTLNGAKVARITKGLYSFALVYDQLDDEAWCSNLTPAGTVSGGGIASTYKVKCFYGNNEVFELDYNPFVIAECDNSADIFTYEVIIPEDWPEFGVASVSIDQTTSTVQVNTDGNQSMNLMAGKTYQFTVRGVLPTQQVNEFQFSMEFNECASMVITAPTFTPQVYYVTQPLSEYVIADWPIEPDLCSGKRRDYTNLVTPANTWITDVSDYNGIGQKVGWQTNDEGFIGEYTIKLHLEGECKDLEATYTLNVKSQCWIDPFEIDKLDAVFKPYTAQNVWQPMSSLIWDQSIVKTTIECGDVEFDIKYADGSAIDTAVFDLVSDGELQYFTEDSSKVARYGLKLIVTLVDFPTNIRSKNFDIEIKDICEEAPSITVSSLADQSYFVGKPPVTSPAFDPFTSDPTYCPFTYDFSVERPLPAADADSVQMDVDTLTFTYSTSNFALVDNYTVTVFARTPLGADSGFFFAYKLDLKESCLLAVLTIDPNIINPAPLSYILEQAALKYILDDTVTSSETEAVCPTNFEFKVTTRDGNVINPPVRFDEDSQELKVFSTDRSHLALSPILLTLHTKYEGAQYNFAGTLDFEIVIVDPCVDTAVITTKPQVNPADYLYESTSVASVLWTLVPYTVDYTCDIIYSCTTAANSPAAGVDICNLNTATLTSSFTALGAYTLTTADMITYPPGDYQLTITGTVGQKSNSETITLKLVNPCPNIQLNMQSPNPLVDKTHYVKDSQVDLSWNAATIISSITKVDCGKLVVQFMNSNESPFDATLFKETRQANDPQLFSLLYTDNATKKGAYPLKYRVSYENYSVNTVDSTVFTITIVDICDTQATITAATGIPTQEYTITDHARKYTLPAYTVNPAWCDITYTISTAPSAAVAAITFDSDQTVREFSFDYSADLDLCGSIYSNVFVTVTGQVGNVRKKQGVSFFTLVLKNPCVDPAFIVINQVALPTDKQYTLYDFKSVGGYTFTHSAFSVVTSPITHSLCGSLTYTATFNGSAINTNTKPPMAYVSATRTFDIYSENFNLLGSRTITVAARLTAYPAIKTANPDVETTIQIIDPCLDPFTLTKAVQANPDPYFYKSVAVPKLLFNLSPYTVVPSICTFTYSCAVNGSRTDICSTTDGDTVATFDSTTGDYTFTSYDMANYAAGDYVFTITGTVGAKFVTSTWTMTLSDPCPTTQLTLKNPDAFKNRLYVLRDPQINREWDIDDIITRATPVDCGNLVGYFKDVNTGFFPDSSIFSDNRSTANAFNFISEYTENVSKKGQYKIKFTIHYEFYLSDSQSKSSIFIVTVIDPCDAPLAVIPSLLFDQIYTITQPTVQYQLPQFVANPIWCAMTYTYSIIQSKGAAAVTFNPAESIRIFKFFFKDDLTLSGPEQLVYTITVVGQAGNDIPKAAVANFKLTIKNPCIDPGFVTIDKAVLLDKIYELYEHDPLGLQFLHDPFTIKTKPIAHSLCGILSYKSKFMTESIDNSVNVLDDPTTDPVGYDQAQRKHTVYSEDFDLLGQQPYTVQASLAEYPAVESQVASAIIEILDPCPDPESVVAKSQTNPPDYSYTAQAPKMLFELDPFVVQPPICSFKYSCKVSLGDRKDLCAITDNDTHGVFSEVTGNYEFYSFDMANYKAGSYTFEITGTVGIKSASATFVMTLVDPCPTTTLTINNPATFIDQTYILRDAQINRTWDIDSILSRDTLVDCGPVSVSFKNNNGAAPDSALFEDDRLTANAYNYASLFTDDVAKKGLYKIKYRVFHTNYGDNKDSSTFKITIVDPCEAPKSITKSSLDDKEYTITDVEKSYLFDVYTVDPAWCEIIYTYDIDDNSAKEAITFDPIARMFKFLYSSDLDMSGLVSKTYVISVKGTSGPDVPQEAKAKFTLTLKNPCIDPVYIVINQVALPLGQQYILHDLKAAGGYKFSHDAFNIVTIPITHSLCGGLTYTATFNDAAIDTSTKPHMAYDTADRTFDTYSEDFAILGTRKITVAAYLTSYPVTKTATPDAETNIEIINPCLDPFSLTSTAQINPAPYIYKSTTRPSIIFTLSQYNVDPIASVCPITYSCAVTGSRTNICSITDGETKATFDTTTGDYSFTSYDMVNYLPGDYEFTITGTVGAKSVTSTWMMTLVDPCPTTQLTINKPAFFVSQDYVLRDPQIDRVWDIDAILSRETPVACGPVTVIFKDKNTGKTPDAVIFSDDRSTPNDFNYKGLSTEIIAKKGLYPIKYTVYHTNYSSNKITSNTFTITVIDPCDKPVSVTAKTHIAQTYTITQDTVDYIVDAYVADPIWCAIIYTHQILPSAGEAALTFDADALSRKFSFFFKDALTLSGATEIEYDITVIGTSGNVTPKTAQASFKLVIKNPCIDSNYLTIEKAALLDQIYELYENDPSGLQFVHDAFTIKTVPIVHSLCGILSYKSKFMTESIDNSVDVLTDPTTDPVGYDQAQRKHTVYSEDFNLLGKQPYTVKASLAEYPAVKSQVASAIIEFVDPCPDPESVVEKLQSNPPDYYYTAQAPKMQFTLIPFVVEPPICKFVYSCRMTSGDHTDLCAISDGSTHGVFSKVTGNYEFYSIDMPNFKPGAYTFEITGTVGTKSASATFVMTLVDPCPTTTLTINNPVPFIKETYILRDAQINRSWDMDKILSRVTLVDCGPVTVTFSDTNTGTTPDAVIFKDDRTTPNAFNYASLQTEDFAKKGKYPIRYIVYHTNYAQNTVQSNTFQVTIADPCEAPKRVTKSSLVNQEYTITDNEKSYSVDIYTVDPAWCEIIYTYDISDATAKSAITFDPIARIFKFLNTADLAISGPVSKTYVISVKGTSGPVVQQSATATFMFTLKNPCIDSDFIIINKVALPTGLKYILHDFKTAGGYKFSHDAFNIVTIPITHSLCGGLTYTATFKGATIDTSTKPHMAYDTADRTFDTYSEDFAILGTRKITVAAYLTSHPVTKTATPDAETNIEIINPCLDPFSLTSTAQINPAPYIYKSTTRQSLQLSLAQYTVDPIASVCPIVYSCAVAGSRTDICSITNGETKATFDTTTGDYSFTSYDMVNYLPGDYEFTITGTVGAKSVTSTWTMTLVDPCLTTQLTIKNPAPFFEQDYILRDSQMNRFWDLDTIVSRKTPVDCGSITVKFIDTNTTAVPDPLVFLDDRTRPNAFNYASLKIQDVDKRGLYLIQYTVYYTNYAFNSATSNIMKITVVDPCDDPVSMTSSVLTNQIYTITQNKISYTVPVYTADPEWCAIIYTYEVTPIAADVAITFDSDSLIRKFDFHYITGLALSGTKKTDYVVKVTGTTGNVVKKSSSATFVLQVKNPCIDAAYVTIEKAVLLSQVYELHELDPEGLEFIHDAFTIKTLPITHSLCGDLVYDSTFMTASIDNSIDVLVNPFANPMGYDQTSREHRVYSEDFDLLGVRPYTVQASLAQYLAVKSEVSSAEIEFLDPCPDPESVLSKQQTNPVDYYYTAQAPKLQFTLTPYVVEPPVCKFIYSCSVKAGDRTDLCAISDGASHGVFSPITGNYQFYSIDMVNYKPGEYTFEITGTVGTKSAKATFVMTLKDPCPTTALTINNPAQFISETYILREAQVNRYWDIDTILSKDTFVDCGPVKVTFIDTNTGSLPDAAIFKDERIIPHAFNYAQLETDDDTKRGLYPIQYTVYHSIYPSNSVKSTTFTVRVLDPCEAPKSVTQSTLVNQQYTITGNEVEYLVDIYTVDPAWCEIIYSYQIDDTAAKVAINFDPVARLFKFKYSDDLNLCDSTSKDYIIAFKGKSGPVEPQSATATFTLKLKNPCIDPAFVVINQVALPVDEEYILHDYKKVGGYNFRHTPFDIVTTPITHTLCGQLSYTAMFNGQVIDTSTKPPMAYNTLTLTFIAYSENFALLGDRTITVASFLTNYPITKSAKPDASTIIELIDPCLDPFSLTPTDQTDPQSYEYRSASRMTMEFTLKQYVVDPDASVCPITYSCTVIGARNDICQLVDGDTKAIFNTATGDYSFTSIDMVNYPPGDYLFTITGTVGAKSVSKTFTMTLVDPCPTTQLTIHSPFFDITYNLHDAQIDLPWNLETIVSRYTPVFCGDLDVVFFNDPDTGSRLAASIFKEDRSAPTNSLLIIPYSEVVNNQGVYPIKFYAHYKDYTSNTITLTTPFKITVIDLCKNDASIKFVSLSDQFYTITEPAKLYVVPQYTVSPVWCDITYSYEAVNPEGGKAFTFAADQTLRTFTIEYLDNLDLSGLFQQVYIITVKGQAGYGQIVTTYASFSLTIKNPCINPSFVQITKGPNALVDTEYVLFEYPGSGFTFTNEAFTVVTSPISHKMCGDLTYLATWRGNALTSTTKPMSYDTSSRSYNIYAEPFSLIGVHPITVKALLTSYSIIVSPTATASIDLIDPCIDPDGITTQIQTNPSRYLYSKEPAIFRLTPFQSVPPGCDITYACLEVIGPSTALQCDVQGVTTFDGVYDNESTDGTWTFQTDQQNIYIEGTYMIVLEGTTGIDSFQKIKTNFNLTIVDPCFFVDIKMTGKLLQNQDILYRLRDAQTIQQFDLGAITEINTLLGCGNYDVVFYAADELKSPLNGNMFSKVKDDFNPQKQSFIVEFIDDWNAPGVYDISYTVFLADYPDRNIEVEKALRVTIQNPCDFNIKPQWCPVQFVDSGFEVIALPEWMEQLSDQIMTLGQAKDLAYAMGAPVNAYGAPLNVRISGGFADRFIEIDPLYNIFRVALKNIDSDAVGTYRIDVISTYMGDNKKEIELSASFLLKIKPERVIDDFIFEAPIDDSVIILENWAGTIMLLKDIAALPEEPEKAQPQPYVVSFSSTGLLKIGWSDEMKNPEDSLDSILRAQVAIQLEEPEKGTRRLKEAYFMTEDGESIGLLNILSALEVKVMNIAEPGNESETTGFRFDIIDYNAESLQLQFYFDDPENVSKSLTDEHELQITFWGTKQFTNVLGFEVPFGKKIQYPIVRQISTEKKEQIEMPLEATEIATLTILCIILLILLCAGPLLPAWMFLNSMQLLLHVPLIKSDMPAHAHFLMVDLLQKLRLHFLWTKEIQEQIIGSYDRDDYNILINDENSSFYTPQIKDCGYHNSLLANMFPFMFIGALIVALWLFSILRDCRHGCATKQRIEPFFTNFKLRFLYEVSFEVCLCTVLYLAYAKNGEHETGFIVSLVVLGLVLFLILFCMMLGCCYGPYINKSYARGTVMRSTWQIRPINVIHQEDSSSSAEDQQVSSQGIVEEKKIESQKRFLTDTIDSQEIICALKDDKVEDQLIIDELKQQQEILRSNAPMYEIGQKLSYQQGSVLLSSNSPDQDQQFEGGSSINKKKLSAETMAQLQTQAKIRIALESQVKVNQRFKTLFYGLKKNHPRNVAVVYPIMFIVRRLIYAFTIVFLLQVPFFAVVVLIASGLIVLSYLLSEGHWEDRLINVQHVINEVALYFVLCHALIFCGLIVQPASASILGWSLIGLLLSTIAINICFMLFASLGHLKLVIWRWYARRVNTYKLSLRKKEKKNLKEQHISIDQQPLKDAPSTRRDDDGLLSNVPVEVYTTEEDYIQINDCGRVNTDEFMHGEDIGQLPVLEITPEQQDGDLLLIEPEQQDDGHLQIVEEKENTGMVDEDEPNEQSNAQSAWWKSFDMEIQEQPEKAPMRTSNRRKVQKEPMDQIIEDNLGETSQLSEGTEIQHFSPSPLVHTFCPSPVVYTPLEEEEKVKQNIIQGSSGVDMLNFNAENEQNMKNSSLTGYIYQDTGENAVGHQLAHPDASHESIGSPESKAEDQLQSETNDGVPGESVILPDGESVILPEKAMKDYLGATLTDQSKIVLKRNDMDICVVMQTEPDVQPDTQTMYHEFIGSQRQLLLRKRKSSLARHLMKPLEKTNDLKLIRVNSRMELAPKNSFDQVLIMAENAGLNEKEDKDQDDSSQEVIKKAPTPWIKEYDDNSENEKFVGDVIKMLSVSTEGLSKKMKAITGRTSIRDGLIQDNDKWINSKQSLTAIKTQEQRLGETNKDGTYFSLFAASAAKNLRNGQQSQPRNEEQHYSGTLPKLYQQQDKFAESCHSWDRDSVDLNLREEVDLQGKTVRKAQEHEILSAMQNDGRNINSDLSKIKRSYSQLKVSTSNLVDFSNKFGSASAIQEKPEIEHVSNQMFDGFRVSQDPLRVQRQLSKATQALTRIFKVSEATSGNVSTKNEAVKLPKLRKSRTSRPPISGADSHQWRNDIDKSTLPTDGHVYFRNNKPTANKNNIRDLYGSDAKNQEKKQSGAKKLSRAQSLASRF